MRYYEIVISPPEGVKVNSNTTLKYSSLASNGQANGAALQIDLDIFQTWYNQPAQNGYIKIHGVDFNALTQNSNFNPIGDKYFSIKVYVGMSKGLPYANPQQAGLILDGSILQAFGNWQGNQTSLDLIVIPTAYIQTKNINLDWYWTTDRTLQQAVERTLNIAYNNPIIEGGFSPDLKYPQMQWGQYLSLTSFAKQIYKYSKEINPDPKYKGASITATPKGFFLWDGTQTTKTEVINVDFQDLIGNITWINTYTIQAKLVMRANLQIGNLIKFPKGVPYINTTGSYAQLRDDVNFNGEYTISQIRHLGSSRQPNGDSWCTIVECVILNAVP